MEWKEQPCWSCRKACGDCSWTEVDPETGQIRYEPIRGWDAEQVEFQGGRGLGNTYKIYECPEYDKEPERATSAEETKFLLLERVSELYKDGCLPQEISEELGIQTRRVLQYLEEAREAGFL